MNATLFNIQRFSIHDGPGIRTTVFFKGCNLRCQWCANPESQRMAVQPELGEEALRGRVWTLEEVVAAAARDEAFYRESGGGVTLSGGEPLLQAEFVCALCDALHARGISVAIETAADVPGETFDAVFSRLDCANIDLKHWDEERHRAGTGAGLARILQNLRRALAGSIPVTVRIPVIPGYNGSPEDAAQFGALLRSLGAQAVQILPFHQLGEKKYEQLGRAYAFRGVPQLHEADLEDYAAILRRAELSVQIGG
ncbi:MAG: glycyl-radical enzyme activating protein [Oscillospiraceae bacterium]|nr:glycyl-radical enzyme activating protein [Oscillospiraceae bacterium]